MKRMIVAIVALVLAGWSAMAAAQDTTSNLELLCTFNTNGADTSGNSRNLTAVGSVTHATGHVSNAATGLYRGSCYQLADCDFLAGETSYSVCFWTRASSRRPQLAAVTIGGARPALVLMPFSTTSSIDRGNGAVAIVNGINRCKFSSVPATSTWAFVAWVVDANGGTLYVDDEAVTTASDCSLPASGLTLTVGSNTQLGWGDADNTIDVDQLRIYSRALAVEDVEALGAE